MGNELKPRKMAPFGRLVLIAKALMSAFGLVAYLWIYSVSLHWSTAVGRVFMDLCMYL